MSSYTIAALYDVSEVLMVSVMIVDKMIMLNKSHREVLYFESMCMPIVKPTSTSTSSRRTSLRVKGKKNQRLQQSLSQFFVKLEDDYGLDADELAGIFDKVDLDTVSGPICKYFLKDGSPCRHPAHPDHDGMCYRHKTCALRYKAIEELFRKRFQEEQKISETELVLSKLSIS